VRIVLDTNVLVSGLLNPYGTCGGIVGLLMAGRVAPCADARILVEYANVLRRPELSIDPVRAAAVLDYIANVAEMHAGTPLRVPLPDPDDSAFLEVALASGADCLVTGNLRHSPPPFPRRSPRAVAVGVHGDDEKDVGPRGEGAASTAVPSPIPGPLNEGAAATDLPP
jgi:putative PIN family toxin of toxin-antitoxin system